MVIDYTTLISNIFICLSIIITFVLCLRFYIVPYLNTKNEIREKEVKNKKYELFMNISPELMQQSLDSYFELYVNRYITYKFLSKKEMYIKQDEVDKMIKDLTKLIYIEISELYVFYISIIYSIENDDSLLKYIKNKVENTCIDAVSSYNRSLE